MRKKSKFQQRLEEIQLKLKNEKLDTGDSGPGEVKLHTIPLPPGREWIPIDIEKPPYYAPIDIWDGMEEFQGWARVCNGDQDFYVNNEDNRVKYHVTHWAKRDGQQYLKYEPMTDKDIPRYSQNDINDIVFKLNYLMAKQKNENYTQGVIDSLKIITQHTTQRG